MEAAGKDTAPDLDPAEILDGIRQWVEIETPTYSPDAVNRLMDLVAAHYADLDAPVERIPGRDGFGDHLIARSPWGDATTPGVLVLSHLDTVHDLGTIDTLAFRVEGDRAYGPGISDMKGGAYLGYHALRELIREGRTTPLPITHLYVSDEEVGSPTSQTLIEDLARRAKYVLVTEPAREGGKIVIARKGSARFEVQVHGRPAHSGSRHQDGRSAIKELARQILRLEDMTDYATGLTVNVGIVSGGTRENVVPAEARAHVDMRIPTAELVEPSIAAVRGLTPVDPDCRITVTGGLNRPPYETGPQIQALFDHAKGVAAEIGFDLIGLKTGGGSDGNFTAPIAPTLDGLGVDGAMAHTLEEHLFVSSLVPRARLMRRLFETLQ